MNRTRDLRCRNIRLIRHDKDVGFIETAGPWMAMEVGIRQGACNHLTHPAEWNLPPEIDGALKRATYLYLAAWVETMALASPLA